MRSTFMQKLKHFLGMWILVGLLAGALMGRFSQSKKSSTVQVSEKSQARELKTNIRKPAARLIHWKASD